VPDNFRNPKEVTSRNNSEHQNLEYDLASHLRQSGKRTVFGQPNIGSRWLTGGRMGIPDVLTIECSFVKPHITVYEVKGERSDFQRDISSGKWRRYLEICNRFYFAAPKGLVKREEIPAEAGLIVKGDKSWTSVKSPPHRGDIEIEESMWLALLFEGYDFALKCRDVEERRRMVQCALDGEPTSYSPNDKRGAAVRNASKIFGDEVGEKVVDLALREKQLALNEEALERATAKLKEVLSLEPDANTYAIERAASERLAQGLGPEVSEVLRKVSYLLEDVARGAHSYEIAAKATGIATAAEAMLESASEQRRRKH